MQYFEEKPKMPAILAYHGQAYKYLKAETLTVDDFNYVQGKLWITSFLYGLLRPLDGIQPYRMEGMVEAMRRPMFPNRHKSSTYAFFVSERKRMYYAKKK